MIQTATLLSLLLCITHSTAFSTVVFGPGPSEMGLLIAKLAARQRIDSTYVCQAGEEDGSITMMYGVDKKPPEGETPASVVASGG